MAILNLLVLGSGLRFFVNLYKKKPLSNLCGPNIPSRYYVCLIRNCANRACIVDIYLCSPSLKQMARTIINVHGQSDTVVIQQELDLCFMNTKTQIRLLSKRVRVGCAFKTSLLDVGDYVDVLPTHTCWLPVQLLTHTHAHSRARIQTHNKYMWPCKNTFSPWRYHTSFWKYDCLHCVRLVAFFFPLTWTLVTIHNSQCSKLLPRIAEMTTQ